MRGPIPYIESFSRFESRIEFAARVSPFDRSPTPDRLRVLRGRSRADYGVLAAKPMTTVFISYRRVDVAEAMLLYTELLRHLGNDRLFFDRNSIRAGADWLTNLREAVTACSAVLAVIGRTWAAAFGDSDGKLDYVRLELEVAQQSGIPVIPILVHDERLPDLTALPTSIAAVFRQQAYFLCEPHPEFYALKVKFLVDQLRLADVRAPALDEVVAALGMHDFGHARQLMHRVVADKASAADVDFCRALVMIGGRSLSAIETTDVDLIAPLLAAAMRARPGWPPPIFLALALESECFAFHGVEGPFFELAKHTAAKDVLNGLSPDELALIGTVPLERSARRRLGIHSDWRT